MILALDVGNTNILAGVTDSGKILFTGRFKTDDSKTETEYAIMFRSFLELHGLPPHKLDAAVMSSVVPSLTTILGKAVDALAHCAVITAGDIDTGLKLSTNNRQNLGQDLSTAAIAALAEYKPPLIIFDMGTATTISAIDANGVYLGCSIAPGIMISHDALAARTSQLPKVALEAPERVIGRSTPECIQSGLVYAQAAMMDGMIERMESELGAKATVLATGGLARFIAKHCKRKIICDDNLILKGLDIIYNRYQQSIN